MRAVLVTLSLVALLVCPALASAQPLPTGSAYIASTGGSCAGAVTQTSCRLANVSCKNLWDPVAGRVFSVDDLTASLKVSDPASGDPIGVILFLMGGGSTAGYESATEGDTVVEAARTAGYRVVQISWASNGGLGAWGGSPSSSSYGGDGYPDGPLYAGGCRAATLFKAIAMSDIMPSGGRYIATGQSGGSAQLTYALARYGLGDWFDGVLLTGGPSIGAMREGCEGSKSAWWQSQCATWRVTVGSACQYGDAEVGGQFIDLLWNDGRRNCALGQAFRASHFSQSYGYQSALGGRAQRRFPYTTIRQLIGDADGSEAVPMGRYLVNKLRDRSGSAVSAVVTVNSVPHLVPDTAEGASAMTAMLFGGTYNGTTYAVLSSAKTTPSRNTDGWTPLNVDGIDLRITTESTAHLWQEPIAAASGQGLTLADDNGESVGGVDDLSPSAHAIVASAAGTSPTLAAGGLSFDGSDVYTIANSATAFDYLHQTANFSIVGYVGFASDGTAMQILENNGSSSANRGIGVFRTSANRLGVQVVYGSSGNLVFNCTSTFTMTAADGVRFLAIVAGNSAGLTMRWGSTTETCARSNAPTGTGAANSIMYVGRRASGLNALTGTIRELSIVRRAISSEELALWAVYAPSRSSTSLVQWTGADAGFYSGLSHWYDFTDRRYLFTDTAGTTPVTTAAQTIALARNKVDPSGRLNRDASQSTAAARPAWVSGGLNGQGAEWDGVDDTLSIASATQPTGASTWVIVAGSQDATVGSHIVSSSGARILLTAPGYDGFSAYTTAHPALGNAGSSTLPNQGITATDANLITVRRQGSAWSVCAGATCDDNDVNTAPFAISRIGESQDQVTFADWWMDGRIRLIMRWNSYLSDQQLSVIRGNLCARFSLTGCGS
jgi:hypothetical protein